MDTLGSPFRGSLEQGWNQSVTESSSSGFTSVTIKQMLDELMDSRNKLSIQSFRRRRRVPGSGSSGISETHWVSVEFVIKGEPSQPVGTEGSLGSERTGRALRDQPGGCWGRGRQGCAEERLEPFLTQHLPAEGSCRVGQRHRGETSRVYSGSCQ